jgi:hypothetical protein
MVGEREYVLKVKIKGSSGSDEFWEELFEKPTGVDIIINVVRDTLGEVFYPEQIQVGFISYRDASDG